MMPVSRSKTLLGSNIVFNGVRKQMLADYKKRLLDQELRGLCDELAARWAAVSRENDRDNAGDEGQTSRKRGQ